MDNAEFQLGGLSKEGQEKLVRVMSHVRKTVHTEQSYDTDPFILDTARAMVRERLTGLDAQDVSLVMRCLYQNTPDKEFIIGQHPEDGDVVLACGFNGGGFQMGPMVARLAIGQLLAQQISFSDLCQLLPPAKVDNNSDYTLDNLDCPQLLEKMKIKFDPSRPSLREYK